MLPGWVCVGMSYAPSCEALTGQQKHWCMSQLWSHMLHAWLLLQKDASVLLHSLSIGKHSATNLSHPSYIIYTVIAIEYHNNLRHEQLQWHLCYEGSTLLAL